MNQVALRLLAVLDESELGLRAVSTAAVLAARLGAQLTVQVAIPIEAVEMRSAATALRAVADHQANCRQRAAEWFERAQALIQVHGVATRTVLTMDEEACAAVMRIASEQGCSLIVVGSHGRGAVSRALSGSLVADLVRLSPVPVLICREDMPPGALVPAVSSQD